MRSSPLARSACEPMARNHVRVLASALAIAVVCGSCQRVPPIEDERQAGKIDIAVAGPMTGPARVFGEQMKGGAEMAVKDINAKGGVLGKKLSLAVGDDACDT